MAKLMNKRDALKYLAEHTTSRMKQKVKDSLKYNTERIKEKFPNSTIKSIDDKNAVRAYYNAIIKEAFSESKIELERGKTKHIRKSTLDNAIKKIQNTNYYSTEDERYARAILKGYEDLGMSKEELRKQLGVSRINPNYFKYIKLDENGYDVIRYEDKILSIQFVYNEDGETIDVKVVVEQIQGPFPEGVKPRRYAI